MIMVLSIFFQTVRSSGIKRRCFGRYFNFWDSKNVLNALEAANNKGVKTIGLLGKGGGKAKSIVGEPIIIPSNSTARIQEMHILIGHILCDLIEEGLNLKK